MTREDFVVLQSDLQKSGMSITKYLQHVGINYNTYNYWRKKPHTRSVHVEKVNGNAPFSPVGNASLSPLMR